MYYLSLFVNIFYKSIVIFRKLFYYYKYKAPPAAGILRVHCSGLGLNRNSITGDIYDY